MVDTGGADLMSWSRIYTGGADLMSWSRICTGGADLMLWILSCTAIKQIRTITNYKRFISKKGIVLNNESSVC